MHMLSLMANAVRPRPAPELPLDDLAGRAQRGDRKSLEELVRRTAPDVLKLCYRISETADYEDNTQRALEKIIVKIGSFDPERGSFRPWALTVARNVCRDKGRRRGVERETVQPETEHTHHLARAGGPDPERLALARVETGELSEALSTLPEPMRDAVVLFHVSGLSYEEIAATLSVPKGTVMTWLHRGRHRLRKLLEARSR